MWGRGRPEGVARQDRPLPVPLLFRVRVRGPALTILDSVTPLVPVPSGGPGSSRGDFLGDTGSRSRRRHFSASRISRDRGCGLLLGASLGGGA